MSVFGALSGGLSDKAWAVPDVVTDEQVAHCLYLDRVTGVSGYGKPIAWMPLAKSSAEKKALHLGATHIVWDGFRPVGVFNGEATARAYVCGLSQQSR
jgi:hypothetical protein